MYKSKGKTVGYALSVLLCATFLSTPTKANNADASSNWNIKEYISEDKAYLPYCALTRQYDNEILAIAKNAEGISNIAIEATRPIVKTNQKSQISIVLETDNTRKNVKANKVTQSAIIIKLNKNESASELLKNINSLDISSKDFENDISFKMNGINNAVQELELCLSKLPSTIKKVVEAEAIDDKANIALKEDISRKDKQIVEMQRTISLQQKQIENASLYKQKHESNRPPALDIAHIDMEIMQKQEDLERQAKGIAQQQEWMEKEQLRIRKSYDNLNIAKAMPTATEPDTEANIETVLPVDIKVKTSLAKASVEVMEPKEKLEEISEVVVSAPPSRNILWDKKPANIVEDIIVESKDEIEVEAESEIETVPTSNIKVMEYAAKNKKYSNSLESTPATKNIDDRAIVWNKESEITEETLPIIPTELDKTRKVNEINVADKVTNMEPVQLKKSENTFVVPKHVPVIKQKQMAMQSGDVISVPDSAPVIIEQKIETPITPVINDTVAELSVDVGIQTEENKVDPSFSVINLVDLAPEPEPTIVISSNSNAYKKETILEELRATKLAKSYKQPVIQTEETIVIESNEPEQVELKQVNLTKPAPEEQPAIQWITQTEETIVIESNEPEQVEMKQVSLIKPAPEPEPEHYIAPEPEPKEVVLIMPSVGVEPEPVETMKPVGSIARHATTEEPLSNYQDTIIVETKKPAEDKYASFLDEIMDVHRGVRSADPISAPSLPKAMEELQPITLEETHVKYEDLTQYKILEADPDDIISNAIIDDGYGMAQSSKLDDVNIVYKTVSLSEVLSKASVPIMTIGNLDEEGMVQEWSSGSINGISEKKDWSETPELSFEHLVGDYLELYNNDCRNKMRVLSEYKSSQHLKTVHAECLQKDNRYNVSFVFHGVPSKSFVSFTHVTDAPNAVQAQDISYGIANVMQKFGNSDVIFDQLTSNQSVVLSQTETHRTEVKDFPETIIIK